MKTLEKARFDARLSKEQKDLFEYASQLGGFTSLTDFVIHVMMDKSTMIIEKHYTILATTRDQELFFNAVTAEIDPNESIKNAAIKYNKLINNLNG